MYPYWPNVEFNCAALGLQEGAQALQSFNSLREDTKATNELEDCVMSCERHTGSLAASRSGFCEAKPQANDRLERRPMRRLRCRLNGS